MNIILALLIIIIIFLLGYYYYSQENFAPYASILADEIINSSASFDVPNQYGEILDPYEDKKVSSEDKLFMQIHAVEINSKM